MAKVAALVLVFVLGLEALVAQAPVAVVSQAKGLPCVEADSSGAARPMVVINRDCSPLAAVALMGAGAGLALGQKDFRNGGVAFHRHGNTVLEDYGRFAPLAATALLKACGVPTRSSWAHMGVASAFSAAVMVPVVQGLKSGVHEVRPDGSDDGSFPSGHTAVAFMCASIMSHELGWRSPWYSVGAYALASGTALLRVRGNHHWADDVVFGAGVGMASVNLGYFLTGLIFKDRGLNGMTAGADDEGLEAARSFVATGMAVGTATNLRNTMGLTIEMGATMCSFVEGAWFWSRWLGAGGRLRAMAAPLRASGPAVGSATMGCVVAEGGLYGQLPLGRRIGLGAKALAGSRVVPGFSFYNDGTTTLATSTTSAFDACVGLSATWLCGSGAGLRAFADYSFSRPSFSFNGGAPVHTTFHEFLAGLAFVAAF